jgi:HK97 family phage prohead protease
MEKEIRAIQMPAKVEERKDGTLGSIYGYPIVYNKDSEDMGFIERIAPGAAKKALKRSNIRGLKNHDPSLIFARQGINLKLKEDADGLRYEATPIDTRTFREVAEEVRLGLLTGQSFGFTVKSDEWSGLDTDKPTRTITEIDQIYDVGPVTYPAYQDTSVALRSMEAAKEKPPFEMITVAIRVKSNDR